MPDKTLCILGCGNLGTAILKSLISAPAGEKDATIFNKFIACVQSERSEQKLREQFSGDADKVSIQRGANGRAIRDSTVVILAVDPATVEETLTKEDLFGVLKGKLLISVVAGWTREKLDNTLLGMRVPESGVNQRVWILRVLPNIAAQVSESITIIEDPQDKDMPDQYLGIVHSIFSRVGGTVRLEPRLMNAATAVGGSTPAFFAVICDALIDAAVAVGVPRSAAQTMIYQSMKGTACMLQSGVHPGILKDQGTSPEGCTIGGLMVLEEAGVRGHIGKALREAVTVARLMESANEKLHVNDTRQ